jgi:hypothetical protein
MKGSPLRSVYKGQGRSGNQGAALIGNGTRDAAAACRVELCCCHEQKPEGKEQYATAMEVEEGDNLPAVKHLYLAGWEKSEAQGIMSERPRFHAEKNHNFTLGRSPDLQAKQHGGSFKAFRLPRFKPSG